MALAVPLVLPFNRRMSTWLAVFILGVIEGITEFLPVSSTGHLLLAQHYMLHHGWIDEQPTDLFNVVIQSGAVLAVLAVFWKRVRGFFVDWKKPETQDYLSKLALAFGITGVGGLTLKHFGLELPETARPVALTTLLGGVAFIGIEGWLKGRPTSDTITWTVAIAVAGGQLLAASFPGTSRSGATILMAMALGVGRSSATEFSFLLGIPTLLAAGAKVTFDFVREGTPHEDWTVILFGSLVAAVSAFLVVRWLLGYIRTHTFVPFGWYRIGVGALLLILLW